MVSMADIPKASLIHKEDPYAAIILKHCRETNCHFCFNELPMDTVPCSSCSTPLYCSDQCHVQAGGKKLHCIRRNISIHENLCDELREYISDVISVGTSASCIEDFTEHSHECQGVHWPLVLPSDIVLAGRVLVKYIKKQRHSGSISDLLGIWDLCHNYAQLPSESKVEFHIYSIILLQCLQRSYGSELPISGKNISQVIILLAQISVNSMAIVRLKSCDVRHLDFFPAAMLASTTTVEQVRVGQAVYSAGSFFNHSCLPNIHAYFVSRSLYVRATEFVAAGSELELSYGPQVGQLDCKGRQQVLEDRYSFRCQCRGCSQLNLSDLTFNAYRCTKPSCVGVVLDSCVLKYEKQKLHCFLGTSTTNSSNPDQGGKLKIGDISKVARRLENNELKPGYCLNCDSHSNLSASHATISEAETFFGRLKYAVALSDVSTITLLDALRSVDLMRKTFHCYNKRIAEVEDTLAQGFCLVGELQAALDHCQKSIEILEELYNRNHIAVGNELLKLASIQICLRDQTAADSLNRVSAIFSRYYGSHVNKIFPLLQQLKKEVLRCN